MSFSVVLPTFNRGHCLQRCIETVLAQRFRDFELLIVDDGSTDNTREIVARQTDGRIRSFVQRNAGPSAARNLGVRHAVGSHVVFIDSDDLCDPVWLESFHAAFAADPLLGFVSCGYWRHAASRRSVTVVLPQQRGPLFHGRRLTYLAGTFAVKREVCLAAGGYDQGLRLSENMELAVRMVAHCVRHGLQVRCIDRPLLHYCMRTPAARGQGEVRAEHRLQAARLFLDRHREALGKDQKVLSTYFAIAGVNAGRLGLNSEARAFLVSAISANPSDWRNYARLAREVLHLSQGFRPAAKHRSSKRRSGMADDGGP